MYRKLLFPVHFPISDCAKSLKKVSFLKLILFNTDLPEHKSHFSRISKVSFCQHLSPGVNLLLRSGCQSCMSSSTVCKCRDSNMIIIIDNLEVDQFHQVHPSSVKSVCQDKDWHVYERSHDVNTTEQFVASSHFFPIFQSLLIYNSIEEKRIIVFENHCKNLIIRAQRVELIFLWKCAFISVRHKINVARFARKNEAV